MNSELFKAILAMDSYNRGNSTIGQGIVLPTILGQTQIGNAIISNDSLNIPATSLGVAAGFYAISYKLSSGGTVISYRGTDVPPSIDVVNGWFQGGGMLTSQAILAAQFYKAVIGTDDPLARNDVSFTGHSLGAGLAGFMATLYNKSGIIFDNMPFELSAKLVPTYAAIDQFLSDTYYFNGATSLNQFPRLVTAYATTGEVLAVLRGVQTTPVHYFDSNGGVRSPVDLHSQALLINLMYAEQAGLTDWHNIGWSFINALFDPAIATAAGFSSVAGVYPAEQKMLSAIAYSAIDEGQRIFGDTAIRAMFIIPVLDTGSRATSCDAANDNFFDLGFIRINAA